MPHHLLKLHDREAGFRVPSALDHLSRAVGAAVPYHLSHPECENCRLLPLHHTHLRVLRFHLHRLPPLVGRVVADKSSLESTYCEDQPSLQGPRTSSRISPPNRLM